MEVLLGSRTLYARLVPHPSSRTDITSHRRYFPAVPRSLLLASHCVFYHVLQLSQGETATPIFTPEDGYNWKIAKACFEATDFMSVKPRSNPFLFSTFSWRRECVLLLCSRKTHYMSEAVVPIHASEAGQECALEKTPRPL